MRPPQRDTEPTPLLAATRAASLSTLRDRLLLAVAGTLAASCGDTTPPVTPRSRDAAPTTASSEVVSSDAPAHPPSAAAPATSAPSAASGPSAPGAARSGAPLDAPALLALGPGCFAPRSVMRSVGTGEPAAAPAASAYDKNGCLPSSLVSNGCCTGAIGGPRFQEGACCYSFPKRDACCGRPFTVAGEALVADAPRGRGWIAAAASPEPTTPHELEGAERACLARGWLRDAQLEHASIASFARFVMDLIALGAPADLVQAAGVAMLDEVEHARLCFALAARFLGEERAPGPLEAAAVAQVRTLEDIVRAAVLEGCVGETAAAHVASVRLEAATDPEVRRALVRIAEDEARHAELAFRFVAWVIRERGEVARACVERAFAENDAQGTLACDDPSPAAGTWLHAFGLLDEPGARVATQAAIEQIVRPAARALRALDA